MPRFVLFLVSGAGMRGDGTAGEAAEMLAMALARAFVQEAAHTLTANASRVVEALATPPSERALSDALGRAVVEVEAASDPARRA